MTRIGLLEAENVLSSVVTLYTQSEEHMVERGSLTIGAKQTMRAHNYWREGIALANYRREGGACQCLETR